MKRDLELVRKILLEAEKSQERFFDIGTWGWDSHDMRYHELRSKLPSKDLFHLDLMEQGGLIKKATCETSDFQTWEITWQGYDFLDAVRSDSLWEQLKAEATAKGVSLTVDAAIGAIKAASAAALSGLTIG